MMGSSVHVATLPMADLIIVEGEEIFRIWKIYQFIYVSKLKRGLNDKAQDFNL